ncbi:MAG: vitamin K epoxide reductase family protein [Ktedonobacteraceae bacterium]|nr:vitamin K epoxide reductase family protein [Ktedonobacteraceae bacterium]
MREIRRAWAQLTLLTLSLMGIGISIYLTAVHYTTTPLVCSTSGVINCERVLSSSYALVPGTDVPISIAGLAWFVIAGLLAVVNMYIWRQGERAIQSIRVAQVGWSILGLLTAFYLVYVEIVKLDALCLWCTILHVIILVMLFITLTQMQRPSEEEEEVEKEEHEITPQIVKADTARRK